jgi:two-component system sensor histidine kinase/response regulator
MGGVEALKELRKMGCNKSIIAVTANAMVSDKERYLKEGFDWYISKPIKMNKLRKLFGLKGEQ